MNGVEGLIARLVTGWDIGRHTMRYLKGKHRIVAAIFMVKNE